MGERLNDTQTDVFVAVFQLADEDTAHARLITQVFLGPAALEPQFLDPISEALASIPLHLSSIACIPSATTLPIGYEVSGRSRALKAAWIAVRTGL